MVARERRRTWGPATLGGRATLRATHIRELRHAWGSDKELVEMQNSKKTELRRALISPKLGNLTKIGSIL